MRFINYNLKYKDPLLENFKFLPIFYGQIVGFNDVLFEEIKDVGNMLVYGTTGSGKSVFLHNIIKTVLDIDNIKTAKVLLVDPKLVEFKQYQNSKLLYRPIVSDSSTFLSCINDLLEECHQREENKDHCPIPARIIVLIDEYNDICNDEIDKALSKLLEIGPNNQIFVILATQNIDGNLKTIEFYRTFTTVVCLQNYSKNVMRKLIGEYVELKGVGDAIVCRNKNKVRVQIHESKLNKNNSDKLGVLICRH